MDSLARLVAQVVLVHRVNEACQDKQGPQASLVLKAQQAIAESLAQQEPKDLREHLAAEETLVNKVRPVLKALWALLVRLVGMGPQDRQAQQAHPGHQGLKAPRERLAHPDSQAVLELQVALVSKDSRDCQAALGLLVQWGQWARLVNLAPQDKGEMLDPREN
jgi:hypothetical protein